MTMKEKKKAASTTANLLNNRSKDNKSSRIIQQVRSIFLSGRKVTAKEINAETNSNDARRVISTLRNDEGWDIKDVRLDDRRKLYWLEPNKRQMSIDYEKALRKLPDKDHIKVSLAGISYITNGKVPHFRGIRKEVFKEIRPILDRWKSLVTPKSE